MLSRAEHRSESTPELGAGLLDLIGALRGQADLAAALRALCERGRALVECTGMMIRLLDGERLVTVALEPVAGGGAWASIALDHGTAPAARAAREGRPAIGAGREELPSALVGLGANRVLAVPLQGPDGVTLGTLSSCDNGVPRDAADWELRCQLLAAQAVETISRARLSEELQSARGHVAELLGLGAVVGGGGTETLLPSVCRLARGLLGAERVRFLGWDAERGEFAVLANDEGSTGGRLTIVPDGEQIVWPDRAASGGRLVVARLSHAGRVHGLLEARRPEPRVPFGDEEVALLERVASLTALALDHAWLARAERPEQANDLVAPVGEGLAELAEASDLATPLARLARRAVSVSGARASLVVLRSAREGRYRIAATHGFPAEAAGLGNTHIGPEAYAPTDTGLVADRRWLEPLAASLGGPGSAPVETSVPLVLAGEVLGVLTLLSAPEARPTADAERTLRVLADHAALFVENASLRAELWEARQLKTQFVATMSHELRTPLNVILGYVDLLLEGAFGSLGEDAHGVLTSLQRNAHELFDLVKQTLDLGRLETGETPLTIERVSIPEILVQLEAEMASTARPGLVVTWNANPSLPMIETDPGKIETVLRHVVGNAFKFTERGRVTVTAERVDAGVLIVVEDTGIGMRDEDLPVIFEMFRQLEPAHTRRHGGIGLGLYTVKRLLEELGGVIDVESTPGEGSRFSIRLPSRAPGA